MTDLDVVVNTIKDTLSPEKIILFGSYASGNNRKNSDFDLAIIQEKKPVNGEIAKVLTNLYLGGYTWNVSPDLHLFSETDFNKRLNNNSLFIREIMKGKIVYEN